MPSTFLSKRTGALYVRDYPFINYYYVFYYYACADTLMPCWKLLKKKNIQCFEEKRLGKISLDKGRQHTSAKREREGLYPTL